MPPQYVISGQHTGTRPRTGPVHQVQRIPGCSTHTEGEWLHSYAAVSSQSKQIFAAVSVFRITKSSLLTTALCSWQRESTFTMWDFFYTTAAPAKAFSRLSLFFTSSSSLLHHHLHLPAAGGLRVLRWWLPTQCSGRCATTQRNTSSSPAGLTERYVLGPSVVEKVFRPFVQMKVLMSPWENEWY